MSATRSARTAARQRDHCVSSIYAMTGVPKVALLDQAVHGVTPSAWHLGWVGCSQAATRLFERHDPPRDPLEIAVEDERRAAVRDLVHTLPARQRDGPPRRSTIISWHPLG